MMPAGDKLSLLRLFAYPLVPARHAPSRRDMGEAFFDALPFERETTILPAQPLTCHTHSVPPRK